MAQIILEKFWIISYVSPGPWTWGPTWTFFLYLIHISHLVFKILINSLYSMSSCSYCYHEGDMFRVPSGNKQLCVYLDSLITVYSLTSSTIVSSDLWFCFPRFRLPVVNLGPKMLRTFSEINNLYVLNFSLLWAAWWNHAQSRSVPPRMWTIALEFPHCRCSLLVSYSAAFWVIRWLSW